MKKHTADILAKKIARLRWRIYTDDGVQYAACTEKRPGEFDESMIGLLIKELGGHYGTTLYQVDIDKVPDHPMLNESSRDLLRKFNQTMNEIRKLDRQTGGLPGEMRTISVPRDALQKYADEKGITLNITPETPSPPPPTEGPGKLISFNKKGEGKSP